MTNKEMINNWQEENEWISDHIDSEIIEAESDMEIMEYALEEIYDERMEHEFEFYKDSPLLLKESLSSTLEELSGMERRYILKDEFEKCHVILKIKNKLSKKYNIELKPLF